MNRSPIGPCILIKWKYSIEFVPIHPKHKSLNPFETVEYRTEKEDWVAYRPNVKQSHKEGKFTYEIKYDPKDHPNLANEDINWGTSEVVIDESSNSVTVRWYDANSPEIGAPARGRLIEQGERVRANTRPIVRNQFQLRNLLLDMDRVCAITKEDTKSALECVHIIAVKDDGFETYRNAILLRADLHCLYDSGGFKISPEGEVVAVSTMLSKYYRDILQGAKLDSKITCRVAAALRSKASGTLKFERISS